MSTETQEPAEMWTRPIQEHEWLKQLLGEWRVVTEMNMGPDQPQKTSEGRETVRSVGGLWAFTGGKYNMESGAQLEYYSTLGFDVSFKEYRGCWFASASSHLWKQVGELSADGKVMTLNCVGPDMVNDGKTANYRDVIEIVDGNTRTMTSYAEGENGEWQQFMKATHTRI